KWSTRDFSADNRTNSFRSEALPGTKGFRLIEISPVKGRSSTSINNEAATPVAKIPSATMHASRLSLSTISVATGAQNACMTRHDPFEQIYVRFTDQDGLGPRGQCCL